VRVARTRRWTRPHTLRFEGIAESRAQIWPRAGERSQLANAPYWGSVACPRTGAARSIDDCVRCEHFVNLRPDPDRRRATMRCLCSDDDPLIRVPCESTWHLVAPETPVASARLLTWAHHVPMLLVARQASVLGVIYAGALQSLEGDVREHMDAEPWSLPPFATLGEAVEALRELRVPGLLVVDHDLELRGVISTADLRRMGVPDAVLAA
jgi:hypothetical protein